MLSSTHSLSFSLLWASVYLKAKGQPVTPTDLTSFPGLDLRLCTPFPLPSVACPLSRLHTPPPHSLPPSGNPGAFFMSLRWNFLVTSRHRPLHAKSTHTLRSVCPALARLWEGNRTPLVSSTGLRPPPTAPHRPGRSALGPGPGLCCSWGFPLILHCFHLSPPNLPSASPAAH